jgi:hypothetical protein
MPLIGIALGILAIAWLALYLRLSELEGRATSFSSELEKQRTAPTREMDPSTSLTRLIWIYVSIKGEFASKVMGASEGEVEELRQLFLADRFEVWRRLEQWTTHTVVFESEKRETNLSRYLSTWYSPTFPAALWVHAFSRGSEKIVQIVLHDNKIKCCMARAWYPPFTPEEDNTFISIPLDEEELRNFQNTRGDYSQTDQRGFCWTLRVQEIAPDRAPRSRDGSD